ncbi:hypothetical protein V2J09_021286 [Rumex salicifolius]
MALASLLTFHHLANFFGILGNIVSFIVFLSPSPTFYNIYKANSTQGFDPLPYSVALFSCMLTGYYGLVKHNVLLITINAVGLVIESIYLTIYMLFASRREKLNAAKLLFSFNVGLLGLIILITTLITHGALRETCVGWICAICSVCVFASPLSVIFFRLIFMTTTTLQKTVITTKSVEFLPFWLSISLTVSAVIWFLFGYFIRDLFVALPNVLGLLFGIAQMTLYLMYKNSKKAFEGEEENVNKGTSELSSLDALKMEAGEIDEVVATCNGDKCIIASDKPPMVDCVV